MTRYAKDYAITIAVMGCRVNGPGETDDADLGLWCGPAKVNLKKGTIALGAYGYDEILPRPESRTRRHHRYQVVRAKPRHRDGLGFLIAATPSFSVKSVCEGQDVRVVRPMTVVMTTPKGIGLRYSCGMIVPDKD